MLGKVGSILFNDSMFIFMHLAIPLILFIYIGLRKISIDKNQSDCVSACTYVTGLVSEPLKNKPTSNTNVTDTDIERT